MAAIAVAALFLARRGRKGYRGHRGHRVPPNSHEGIPPAPPAAGWSMDPTPSPFTSIGSPGDSLMAL